MYSAGLTTLTLGIKVKRVYAVTLDVLVTFIGALYFMLVADSFYTPFITIISVLAIPITAWLAVFLVDMIKRHNYDPDALLNLRSDSGYWYRGGIEWRAFGSWAIAIVVGLLFSKVGPADAPWFTGLFSHTWVATNGLAWVATFVIAGGLYFVLGGARAGVILLTSTGAEEEVSDHV